MSTKSNTFCILPWIHTYIGSDGNVLPCCIADQGNKMGNVQNNSLQDIWNSASYRQLRVNMLSGQRCDECKSCYKDEDTGRKSFRNEINERFKVYYDVVEKTTPVGYLDEMKFRYLDIRWSNICNFKCRTCNSTFSSSWATENNDKKIFIFAGGGNNDKLYEELEAQLEYLDEIYFAGGEPLLMDAHYNILIRLLELGRKDVKLRYSTNLSTLYYKKKSIVDLWNQFWTVQIYVSIDSWGDRAEYIREGTNWNQIEENIRIIRKELPRAYIATSSVISVFNVATLPEFLDRMYDVFGDQLEPQLYVIKQPKEYSFAAIQPDLKERIISNLNDYIGKCNSNAKEPLRSVITALQTVKFNSNLRIDFEDANMYFDTIRNRDFNKTFPELENF